MRLAFTSDLHGNVELYRATLDFARQEQADLLVLGGDLFPLGREIGPQRDFARRELPAILATAELPVYAIAGNGDWSAAYPYLEELAASGRLTLLDHRAVEVEGSWTLIGYPRVPPTPFYIKDNDRRDLPGDPVPNWSGLISQVDHTVAVEVPAYLSARPSIEDELAALPRAQDPARTIYVFHGPPFDTALDRITNGQPVGSRAVRAFLSASGAPLALHGHIHEAPQVSGRYWERLGSTLCVNPGQGSQLHAVVVDPARPDETLRHTIFGGPQ